MLSRLKDTLTKFHLKNEEIYDKQSTQDLQLQLQERTTMQEEHSIQGDHPMQEDHPSQEGPSLQGGLRHGSFIGSVTYMRICMSSKSTSIRDITRG